MHFMVLLARAKKSLPGTFEGNVAAMLATKENSIANYRQLFEYFKVNLGLLDSTLNASKIYLL